MNVILDGTVFEEPFAGVAKVTKGLYEACLSARPDMNVSVLHRRGLAERLPDVLHSRRMGWYLSHEMWRKRYLPLLFRGDSDAIFHFPSNGNIPPLKEKHPIVMTLHDVLPLAIPDYFADAGEEAHFRKRTQSDLDRAHLVITVSEFSRSEILKNFKVSSEPLVIYPGPTLRLPPEIPGFSIVPKTPYFLYVGGYDKRKGLETLLRVFLELREAKLIASGLLLAGLKIPVSTEFEKLVAAAVAKGFAEELGYVSDGQLAGLLRSARALVYPSPYEGFGLPALEAMNIGCPVIVSHATSLPEVCGEAGNYIDLSHPRTLSSALIALEQSDELRARHIALGLHRAERFTWHDSALRYLSALDTLIGRTARG